MWFFLDRTQKDFTLAWILDLEFVVLMHVHYSFFSAFQEHRRIVLPLFLGGWSQVISLGLELKVPARSAAQTQPWLNWRRDPLSSLHHGNQRYSRWLLSQPASQCENGGEPRPQAACGLMTEARGWQNFCQGPDCKYFRLSESYDLSHNNSTLPRSTKAE